jgi:hypothetical protein
MILNWKNRMLLKYPTNEWGVHTQAQTSAYALPLKRTPTPYFPNLF